jgi:diguanylate cyclase (GGDEF)-like protein
MEGRDNSQQIANSMLGALLAHVRASGGDDTVDEVLAAAGETRTAAELRDPTGWSSYVQGRALFAAAARVLDDPDVGRKAGMELLRQYAGSEVIALLRSFGSFSEMLRAYPAIQAKQSTVTRSEVVDVGEVSGSLSVTTVNGIRRDRLFCDYTTGVLSQLPVLFGMEPATVQEPECQTRGDGRCRYDLRWDPRSSFEAGVESELEYLREQIGVLTRRFESLEAVAMELSSARDVDAVLETIARHAGVAVRAPRYLLAVRLPGDHALRVHSVGFPDGLADRVAAQLVTRERDSGDRSQLTVDIASARTHFGRLAAYFPEGYQFLPRERALLLSYAGHAAAALETVAALDEARERNVTLGALLALGNALSQVSNRHEVALRVAEASPGIVGCEQAHVLLWDGADAVLRRTATWPPPADGVLPVALRDLPLPGRLGHDSEPFVVSAGSDPALRGVLTLTGLDDALVVALAARGDLLGALVAGDPAGERRWSDVVRERLTGVASLASTALDGVNLLDEVRHQAHHDTTTDLPNARLFEDRVTQTIARARRDASRHALLFVDLDHFKDVNDTHGHKVGDELLRAAAARLSTSVRSSDTVARIGGDEFGVLLQALAADADAATVAGKIVGALREPFALRGLTLAVGASVGIAHFPRGTDTYETVLARADAAMYDAKAGGRDRFAVFDEREADLVPGSVDRPRGSRR